MLSQPLPCYSPLCQDYFYPYLLSPYCISISVGLYYILQRYPDRLRLTKESIRIYAFLNVFLFLPVIPRLYPLVPPPDLVYTEIDRYAYPLIAIYQTIAYDYSEQSHRRLRASFGRPYESQARRRGCQALSRYRYQRKKSKLKTAPAEEALQSSFLKSNSKDGLSRIS